MIVDPFSVLVGLAVSVALVIGAREVSAGWRQRRKRAEIRATVTEMRRRPAPSGVRVLRNGPGPKGAA